MYETGGFYNAVAPQAAAGFRSSTSAQTDALHLRPVDSVDITIVVDNFMDLLLASNDRVHRPTLEAGWSKRPKLVAEHGHSILFTFRKKGEEKTLL